MRVTSVIVCGLVLQLPACSGRVDCDCEGPVPDATPAASCQDSDGDGYLAAPDGGPCPESEAWFEPSDCDDQDSGIHPGSVEWIGDGEDWDCDGRDAPDLCLVPELDWVGEPPESCAEGNLVIQHRPTCDVCRGTLTYVVLRVASVVEPWHRANELYVVTDGDAVFRVSLPGVEGTSTELVVPAVWRVDAYLDHDGCLDPNGFVSAPTLASSCTQ